MKSFRYLLPFICVSFLYSCATGKVNDYVGVYRIESAVEEEWYHYWSEPEKMKSSKTLPCLHTVIYINKNKSVTYRLGSESKTGKIKCYKDYCTFTDVSGVDSSWQFKLSSEDNEKKLAHYSRSKDYGFVYDFTKTRVTLNTYVDPNDFNNYIGTYSIYISKHVTETYEGMSKTDTTTDEDYKSLVNKQLIINSDKTFTIPATSYSGVVTFNDAKITFHFSDQSFFKQPIIMSSFSRLNKIIYIQSSGNYQEAVQTTPPTIKKYMYTLSIKR